MDLVVGVAQAIALAFLGFAFWRLQMIGQRRFVLAEDAIVTFRKAAFALAWARNGMSFEGEGATRKRGEHESEATTKTLDVFYTSIERLRASEQIFADLEKTSLLTHHHLGADAFEAFNVLTRARNRVYTSAGMLIRTFRPEGPAIPDALRERLEDDIWGGNDPASNLTKEIEAAEAVLREICDREARMMWPFRFSSRRRPRTGVVDASGNSTKA